MRRLVLVLKIMEEIFRTGVERAFASFPFFARFDVWGGTLILGQVGGMIFGLEGTR